MDGSVVEGLSQTEVVQLLRESQGSVSLLISRQQVIEKQEETEVRLEPTIVMMSPHDIIVNIYTCTDVLNLLVHYN